ncbi:hypothetical protein K438DRAFT_1821021 [Mycena galopus ATCC 62051]|nr:hypothetical protein K438DRAFT_1821021 [Mycena galopus ATCC 62051]
MSSPSNTPAVPATPQQRANRTLQALKLSPESQSDWLATSITTAKAVTAAAVCIPFPYVQGVFGTVVVILETVEKIKRNRDDLRELCEDIVKITKAIQERISSHGDGATGEFQGLCENLEGLLQDVLKAVKDLHTEPRGFPGRFKEILKLHSTADRITGYRLRIRNYN